MSDTRVKRYDCTDGGVQFCHGCYTMTQDDAYGDWVKYEDYAELERELAEARKEIERMRPVVEAAIDNPHFGDNGPKLDEAIDLYQAKMREASMKEER